MSTPAANSPEQIIWSGSPSQFLNLGVFILCALTFWLVIPILIALWRWLVVRCTRFELTSERLIVRRGVLNRTTDEIELYRVKDTRLDEPLILRLVGCGNIVLSTSDRSTPILEMRAIRDANSVRESIRREVERIRETKQVREVDFE